ncbi:hypothetical protein SDJN02_13454, partial [Cucurbita argyrosperma subsp. argyrosperma]
MVLQSSVEPLFEGHNISNILPILNLVSIIYIWKSKTILCELILKIDNIVLLWDS